MTLLVELPLNNMIEDNSLPLHEEFAAYAKEYKRVIESRPTDVGRNISLNIQLYMPDYLLEEMNNLSKEIGVTVGQLLAGYIRDEPSLELTSLIPNNKQEAKNSNIDLFYYLEDLLPFQEEYDENDDEDTEDYWI